ncbi:MAG: intradiol ring-cleavage dioxygenase [Deltaproteobacteria bacterium]|nr:intradiol ring-cleavage dioxygenase [Deltaproteobacteria bacterium]
MNSSSHLQNVPRNPLRNISLALLFLLGAAHAAAEGGALVPTPETGFGPFYPAEDALDRDHDLTRFGDSDAKPNGQIIEVEGIVRDVRGEVLVGAEVVIWQTDTHGKYNHPSEDRKAANGGEIPLDPGFQYWGRTRTDADGKYFFRTIIPGSYGRARHIHCSVSHRKGQPFATEMHFANDPLADDDFVTSRQEHDRLIVELEATTSGVLRGRFDIVVPEG